MDIFLVNKKNKYAESLMDKLAVESKPGAIIALTDGEMDLYNSNNFQHVHISGDNENSKVIKIDRNAAYVFICDENDIIDDVIRTINTLGLDASIVRRNT